jgi:hypothetical protein
MNRTLLLIVIFFLMTGVPAFAQDSLQNVDPTDSVVITKHGKVQTIESYAARFNPRRALWLSAVFPGAGQAYNKKYWKMPLVYGGFGGIGYSIWWNQRQYMLARTGLFSLLNEPSTPVVDPTTGLTKYGNRVVNGKVYHPVGQGLLSLDVARTATNKFRRDRDFSVIMCFVFYMLQLVDAHIDAHLKEFDLNPQLKVSVEPNSIKLRF